MTFGMVRWFLGWVNGLRDEWMVLGWMNDFWERWMTYDMGAWFF